MSRVGQRVYFSGCRLSRHSCEASRDMVLSIISVWLPADHAILSLVRDTAAQGSCRGCFTEEVIATPDRRRARETQEKVVQ